MIRKSFMLLVAVLALIVPMSALAANQTVAVTKAGFVPGDVTVNQGEQVTFSNTDTVARVISFNKMTGITCSANPILIQPGTSASCTFTTAGSYTFEDPNNKGRAFRGSVTVKSVAVNLTLATSKSRLVYGQATVLSGKLSSGEAGVEVTLLARRAGQNFTPLANLTTTAGGAYSRTVNTGIYTTYTVRYKQTESNAVSVAVRPRVALTYATAKRLFCTKAVAARSFAGKYVRFQRFNRFGEWATVKSVRLNANSAACFRSALPSGASKVRVVLPQLQAGSGYLAGISRVLTVYR